MRCLWSCGPACFAAFFGSQTKFRLALACGNIEVAMHTADMLPDDAIWHQLGTEALRQGNHEVGAPRRAPWIYQRRAIGGGAGGGDK